MSEPHVLELSKAVNDLALEVRGIAVELKLTVKCLDKHCEVTNKILDRHSDRHQAHDIAINENAKGLERQETRWRVLKFVIGLPGIGGAIAAALHLKG